MNLHSLIDLFRHMEWADASVWTSALASESGQTDEKLRQYFYHLHLVQRAFLRLWRGEARETPYPTFDDAPSLMAWGRSYYGEAMSHLETMNDEVISSPMPVAWASMVEQRLGRAPEMTTVGETVLQVAMHSQYHRGQINARLRQLEVETPLVDYIAWIWLGRPSPQWPEVAS
jgi:uncharacterized damage-inducible protein DinB